MAKLSEVLEKLGEDLISRQINLILASGGMSAELMPDDPTDTLREVYRWYHNKLSLENAAAKVDEGVAISEYTAARLHRGFNELARDLEPFTTMADVRAAESVPTAVVPDADSVAARVQTALDVTERLLYRMRSTSLELAKIADKRAKAEELDARDLAILRKAWEIGVDEIILQTTVGLDGDVVTRVDSRFVDETRKPLHGLHDQSVSAAMRTWKDVVGAAIDLINKLFAKV